MTPEQAALRDAWLSECWPTCPEVPREDRAAERALARIRDTVLAADEGTTQPDRAAS